MTAKTTTPFRPDGPFRARMAEGHLARTGHVLTGFYTLDDNGWAYVLTRTCACAVAD